jgi:hypothetical protein
MAPAAPEAGGSRAFRIAVPGLSKRAGLLSGPGFAGLIVHRQPPSLMAGESHPAVRNERYRRLAPDKIDEHARRAGTS